MSNRSHDRLEVQPRPRGEDLFEPALAERLAELRCQLGLTPPERWPHPNADSLTQTLGRSGQQRRPLRVTLEHCQSSEADAGRWVMAVVVIGTACRRRGAEESLRMGTKYEAPVSAPPELDRHETVTAGEPPDRLAPR